MSAVAPFVDRVQQLNARINGECEDWTVTAADDGYIDLNYKSDLIICIRAVGYRPSQLYSMILAIVKACIFYSHRESME